MKLKTLALTAFAGLFSASLAFAAPAQLTDDINTMGSDTGNLNAPNGNDNIANPNSDSNNVGMGGTEANNDTIPPASGAPSTSPNQASNSNDDMSADTATGDDDY